MRRRYAMGMVLALLMSPLFADASEGEVATKPEVASAVAEEKESGLSLFWLIFGVSVIFVFGSASALKYLGPPPKSRQSQSPSEGKPWK